VVLSLAGCAEEDRPAVDEMVRRGVGWLVSAQGPDGGWGGAPGTPCSIEETALATDALAKFLLGSPRGGRDGELVESVESAIPRGVSWLVRNTNRGETMDPSPIGFYFAKLWYFERMYPLVFTVSAMERVAQLAKRQADTWG
jgi:squalene-hopene/tetraprenyl-beta-curcumene cyclase